MTARRVWYAAYGSNLSRERFACYLRGGVPAGGKLEHRGCADPTMPAEDRPVRLAYRLYFAGESRTWGGGVAFLGDADPAEPTLGRAYLITHEQFRDVVAQENHVETADLDLDRATRDGRWQGPGRYGDVVWCGRLDGAPLFTFTGPQGAPVEVNAPRAAYLATMAAGLGESHELSHGAIVDYLCGLTGVSGVYDVDDMAAMVAPPRHSSPA